jgi:7-dehydrocholesterol reductase
MFWYINTSLSGSFLAFFDLVTQKGLFATLFSVFAPVAFGSKTAWTILAVFAAFQLLLMRVLPGKPFLGPITPKGNQPVYKANGFPAFLVTLGAYLGATSSGLFSATLLYDHMGELLGAINLFSLFFCLFLYFKGVYRPSSTDSGRSGNPLFDYYWGTELYPRIFGFDVKQFTNCRFGMMSWTLILFSYAAKQQALYGLSDAMAVSVALQTLYVAKFFLWETGYLRSLDIMHDRAGYYICWGCLVWVPCVYPLPGMYLVHNPIHLGLPLSTLIFSLGAASILINYLADLQRQRVRALQGNCLVWKKPPRLIQATYTTETGENKETFLLACGWWGLSRHFHYIPEIAAAFFWALPALFTHFMPYFYVIYLTILLVHRAFRHDARCKAKYGPSWDAYCEAVPYKIIPGIF